MLRKKLQGHLSPRRRIPFQHHFRSRQMRRNPFWHAIRIRWPNPLPSHRQRSQSTPPDPQTDQNLGRIRRKPRMRRHGNQLNSSSGPHPQWTQRLRKKLPESAVRPIEIIRTLSEQNDLFHPAADRGTDRLRVLLESERAHESYRSAYYFTWWVTWCGDSRRRVRDEEFGWYDFWGAFEFFRWNSSDYEGFLEVSNEVWVDWK